MINKVTQIYQQNHEKNKTDPNLSQKHRKLRPNEFFPGLLNTEYFSKIQINQQPLKKKSKNEQWSLSQVQKLFSIYADYGPQWKIIQTQLPHKSSNSIKNRFYSVVRALLRELFLSHPQLKNQILSQISSKTILRFYEGQFYKFKGFGKKVLKTLNYDVQSEELVRIAQKKFRQIASIYQLIYKKSLPLTEKDQKSSLVSTVHQKKKLSQSRLPQIHQQPCPQYQTPNEFLYPYPIHFNYVLFSPSSVSKSDKFLFQSLVLSCNNLAEQR